VSGNPYVYLARHPRLAAHKVSERLGLSDPVENLAEEADRHERALRDINRRLLELGGFGSPTGRAFVRLDYQKAEIRISARAAKRRRAVAKEPFTVAWLERELRADDVLYDIGANVGAYTLIAAVVGGDSVRVVAFEPGAETFGVLCENIVLNDVAAKVVPLPVVLGPETGLATFGYTDLRAGAAQHDSSASADEGRFVYRQPVLQVSLDDLVRRFPLPKPTLVKIDVDGAEVGVLQGARELLLSRNLRSVLVEMRPGTRDVSGALEDAEFSRAETYARGGVEYGLFIRRGP
jgi:FkbM family methyltransferase